MALIKWSELREEEFEDAVVFPAFEFGDVSGLVEWRAVSTSIPCCAYNFLKEAKDAFYGG